MWSAIWNRQMIDLLLQKSFAKVCITQLCTFERIVKNTKDETLEKREITKKMAKPFFYYIISQLACYLISPLFKYRNAFKAL